MSWPLESDLLFMVAGVLGWAVGLGNALSYGLSGQAWRRWASFCVLSGVAALAGGWISASTALARMDAARLPPALDQLSGQFPEH